MVQNEFEFDAVEKSDVNRFVRFITDYKDWITAKEIYLINGWTDRNCRELAHHSGGRIISGQKGYRATSCATVEERAHATAWLRSQAHKMDVRAMEIEFVEYDMFLSDAVQQPKQKGTQ